MNREDLRLITHKFTRRFTTDLCEDFMKMTEFIDNELSEVKSIFIKIMDLSYGSDYLVDPNKDFIVTAPGHDHKKDDDLEESKKSITSLSAIHDNKVFSIDLFLDRMERDINSHNNLNVNKNLVMNFYLRLYPQAEFEMEALRNFQGGKHDDIHGYNIYLFMKIRAS